MTLEHQISAFFPQEIEWSLNEKSQVKGSTILENHTVHTLNWKK